MKLSEIEVYLNSLDLTKIETPIQLSAESKIIDLRVFIESHLSILKANTGNKRFMPYYDRLMMFVNKIKNN